MKQITTNNANFHARKDTKKNEANHNILRNCPFLNSIVSTCKDTKKNEANHNPYLRNPPDLTIVSTCKDTKKNEANHNKIFCRFKIF